MHARAREPQPFGSLEPFGPTSRPRGLLERDTGGGSEPGRTCGDVSSDLPASREAPGRTAAGFLSDVGCGQVFGLASLAGFRRFSSATASQLRRASACRDVVLAYRCGAAPEFPPGSLLSPEPKLRAPA